MDKLSCRLLVCGPAGAGKSTLIKRISQDYNASTFDVRTLVIDFLRRTGKKELIGDELKPFYEELILNLSKNNCDILEIANDWPELFFDRIINNFFRNYVGKIIYVDSLLETSLERMKLREYPTPISAVKRGYQYSFEYYQAEAKKKDISILSISGEKDFEGEYAKVKKFLDSK